MGNRMRKLAQSTRQRNRRQDDTLPYSFEEFDRPQKERRELKPLAPRTEAQRRYMSAIKSQTLTFGIGPAGTGKTFVAATLAAEMLDNHLIEKIIVTRPAIEAGEELGFLPGEMEEKIAPYFQPVLEALERRLGKGRTEYALKAKQIEFVPLAYMRGRTFDNAFVILDEAQNTTPKQMKMFLTRIGENSKVVVDGDLKQSDIPGTNGLYDGLEKIHGMKGIQIVRFTRADVVRSGLAQQIVDAYEGEEDIPLPDFITNPVKTY